jgi:prepilin-type N-terminal cleavage/methylation domain-containing protein
MIFHRLRLINKDQKGFTLTELILAICIGAIITAVATLVIFQVIIGSARSINHMTAVRQVQSAGFWVSHDAQMASQEPDIEENGGNLESITLNWTDGDGTDNQVVYSLLDDNQLQRSHLLDSGTPTVATVAQYIDRASTTCEFTNGVLTFTVTATVGEQTETRTYKVAIRPSL